jgi:hypothetical protein
MLSFIKQDTDRFAVKVEQGSTAVAERDGSVCLVSMV